MKAVDISEKKPACPFCGARPACPGWTCKRLASVTVDADGSYTVEFIGAFPPIDPPDGGAA